MEYPNYLVYSGMIGDKIVCINAFGMDGLITIGKEYAILFEDKNIEIFNDKGRISVVEKNRFKRKQDYTLSKRKDFLKNLK